MKPPSHLAWMAPLVAVACATTTPTRVGAPVTYDSTVDFATYRTFSLAEENTRATGAQQPVLAAALGSVARGLESVGLKQSSGRADVVVAFTPGGHQGPGPSPAVPGEFSPSIDPRDLDPSALVIDLRDGKTGRLVWRTVADGALLSPASLDDAVLRAFRAYYPARPAYFKKPP